MATHFHRAKKGTIAGVPFSIIILAVIVKLTIYVVLFFMLQPPTPPPTLSRIEVNPGVIKSDVTSNITITAFDTKGGRLQGATITIDGGGITPQAGKTGRDGKLTFRSVTPTLPINDNFGDITVTAKYTGTMPVTKTTTITVTKS